MAETDAQPEVLTPAQLELVQLAELAHLPANPEIMRLLISLLEMNASPTGIYRILRLIRKSTQLVHSSKTRCDVVTVPSIPEN